MPGPAIRGYELKKKKGLKGIWFQGNVVKYVTKGGKVREGLLSDKFWCRNKKKGLWSKKDDDFDRAFVAKKIKEKWADRYGHIGDVNPNKRL